MSVKQIIKTKRGKGGGTMAHWFVAMKYAVRQVDTQEFIAFQAKLLNLANNEVCKTRRGCSGGTVDRWVFAMQ